MKLPRKDNETELTISNRTVIRVLLIVVAVLYTLRFISNVSHVLELIFIAAFLALALNPAVGWISHKLRLKSRVIATGIAFIVVIIILIGFVSLVVPPLVRQTVDYFHTLPQTVSNLKDSSTSAGKFVQHYHLEDQINGLSQNIKDRTKNIQEPVFSTATKVGSALISILTVLVLTFMMLVEGPEIIDRYWRMGFHSEKNKKHHQELANRMYGVVTGYVNGQFLLALIGAVLGMIALLIASSLLNVSVNAVALAGILFLTGLIPMVGHIIGAVIVVAACLFVSLPLAIIMGIFLILHQQIENVTLQPYIQAKYNELTPLLVFIAALVGVGFGGLLGAFIAIPAAGCAKILFQDYMARRDQTTN